MRRPGSGSRETRKDHPVSRQALSGFRPWRSRVSGSTESTAGMGVGSVILPEMVPVVLAKRGLLWAGARPMVEVL
jgi:hypothetical protein